jgi:hypothetical protein
MMVNRWGTFLFPLYVSASNEMVLWLMARKVAFLLLSIGAVLQGRDLSLKSSIWIVQVVRDLLGMRYFGWYILRFFFMFLFQCRIKKIKKVTLCDLICLNCCRPLTHSDPFFLPIASSTR